MQSAISLDDLSEDEQSRIWKVLQRDELLRQNNNVKVSKLKGELYGLRMKGILRDGDDSSRLCVRCHCELGIFFNKGEICPSCRFKICKTCRVALINGGWTCIYCFKQMQLKWLSGEWIRPHVQRQSITRRLSGSDIVRSAFSSGNAGKAVTEEIRRAITNGSGPPSSEDLERTSSFDSSPIGASTLHDAEVERVGFPSESDSFRLSRLIGSYTNRSTSNEEKERVCIKRASSRPYRDSDSDSSSSTATSPVLSAGRPSLARSTPSLNTATTPERGSKKDLCSKDKKTADSRKNNSPGSDFALGRQVSSSSGQSVSPSEQTENGQHERRPSTRSGNLSTASSKTRLLDLASYHLSSSRKNLSASTDSGQVPLSLHADTGSETELFNQSQSSGSRTKLSSDASDNETPIDSYFTEHLSKEEELKQSKLTEDVYCSGPLDLQPSMEDLTHVEDESGNPEELILPSIEIPESGAKYKDSNQNKDDTGKEGAVNCFPVDPGISNDPEIGYNREGSNFKASETGSDSCSLRIGQNGEAALKIEPGDESETDIEVELKFDPGECESQIQHHLIEDDLCSLYDGQNREALKIEPGNKPKADIAVELRFDPIECEGQIQHHLINNSKNKSEKSPESNKSTMEPETGNESAVLTASLSKQQEFISPDSNWTTDQEETGVDFTSSHSTKIDPDHLVQGTREKTGGLFIDENLNTSTDINDPSENSCDNENWLKSDNQKLYAISDSIYDRLGNIDLHDNPNWKTEVITADNQLEVIGLFEIDRKEYFLDVSKISIEYKRCDQVSDSCHNDAEEQKNTGILEMSRKTFESGISDKDSQLLENQFPCDQVIPESLPVLNSCNKESKNHEEFEMENPLIGSEFSPLNTDQSSTYCLQKNVEFGNGNSEEDCEVGHFLFEGDASQVVLSEQCPEELENWDSFTDSAECSFDPSNHESRRDFLNATLVNTSTDDVDLMRYMLDKAHQLLEELPKESGNCETEKSQEFCENETKTESKKDPNFDYLQQLEVQHLDHFHSRSGCRIPEARDDRVGEISVEVKSVEAPMCSASTERALFNWNHGDFSPENNQESSGEHSSSSDTESDVSQNPYGTADQLQVGSGLEQLDSDPLSIRHEQRSDICKVLPSSAEKEICTSGQSPYPSTEEGHVVNQSLGKSDRSPELYKEEQHLVDQLPYCYEEENKKYITDQFGKTEDQTQFSASCEKDILVDDQLPASCEMGIHIDDQLHASCEEDIVVDDQLPTSCEMGIHVDDQLLSPFEDLTEADQLLNKSETDQSLSSPKMGDNTTKCSTEKSEEKVPENDQNFSRAGIEVTVTGQLKNECGEEVRSSVDKEQDSIFDQCSNPFEQDVDNINPLLETPKIKIHGSAYFPCESEEGQQVTDNFVNTSDDWKTHHQVSVSGLVKDQERESNHCFEEKNVVLLPEPDLGVNSEHQKTATTLEFPENVADPEKTAVELRFDPDECEGQTQHYLISNSKNKPEKSLESIKSTMEPVTGNESAVLTASSSSQGLISPDSKSIKEVDQGETAIDFTSSCSTIIDPDYPVQENREKTDGPFIDEDLRASTDINNPSENSCENDNQELYGISDSIDDHLGNIDLFPNPDARTADDQLQMIGLSGIDRKECFLEAPKTQYTGDLALSRNTFEKDICGEKSELLEDQIHYEPVIPESSSVLDSCNEESKYQEDFEMAKQLIDSQLLPIDSLENIPEFRNGNSVDDCKVDSFISESDASQVVASEPCLKTQDNWDSFPVSVDFSSDHFSGDQMVTGPFSGLSPQDTQIQTKSETEVFDKNETLSDLELSDSLNKVPQTDISHSVEMVEAKPILNPLESLTHNEKSIFEQLPNIFPESSTLLKNAVSDPSSTDFENEPGNLADAKSLVEPNLSQEELNLPEESLESSHQDIPEIEHLGKGSGKSSNLDISLEDKISCEFHNRQDSEFQHFPEVSSEHQDIPQQEPSICNIQSEAGTADSLPLAGTGSSMEYSSTKTVIVQDDIEPGTERRDQLNTSADEKSISDPSIEHSSTQTAMELNKNDPAIGKQDQLSESAENSEEKTIDDLILNAKAFNCQVLPSDGSSPNTEQQHDKSSFTGFQPDLLTDCVTLADSTETLPIDLIPSASCVVCHDNNSSISEQSENSNVYLGQESDCLKFQIQPESDKLNVFLEETKMTIHDPALQLGLNDVEQSKFDLSVLPEGSQLSYENNEKCKEISYASTVSSQDGKIENSEFLSVSQLSQDLTAISEAEVDFPGIVLKADSSETLENQTRADKDCNERATSVSLENYSGDLNCRQNRQAIRQVKLEAPTDEFVPINKELYYIQAGKEAQVDKRQTKDSMSPDMEKRYFSEILLQENDVSTDEQQYIDYQDLDFEDPYMPLFNDALDYKKVYFGSENLSPDSGRLEIQFGIRENAEDELFLNKNNCEVDSPNKNLDFTLDSENRDSGNSETEDFEIIDPVRDRYSSETFFQEADPLDEILHPKGEVKFSQIPNSSLVCHSRHFLEAIPEQVSEDSIEEEPETADLEEPTLLPANAKTDFSCPTIKSQQYEADEDMVDIGFRRVTYTVIQDEDIDEEFWGRCSFPTFSRSSNQSLPISVNKYTKNTNQSVPLSSNTFSSSSNQSQPISPNTYSRSSTRSLREMNDKMYSGSCLETDIDSVLDLQPPNPSRPCQLNVSVDNPVDFKSPCGSGSSEISLLEYSPSNNPYPLSLDSDISPMSPLKDPTPFGSLRDMILEDERLARERVFQYPQPKNKTPLKPNRHPKTLESSVPNEQLWQNNEQNGHENGKNKRNEPMAAHRSSPKLGPTVTLHPSPMITNHASPKVRTTVSLSPSPMVTRHTSPKLGTLHPSPVFHPPKPAPMIPHRPKGLSHPIVITATPSPLDALPSLSKEKTLPHHLSHRSSKYPGDGKMAGSPKSNKDALTDVSQSRTYSGGGGGGGGSGGGRDDISDSSSLHTTPENWLNGNKRKVDLDASLPSITISEAEGSVSARDESEDENNDLLKSSQQSFRSGQSMTSSLGFTSSMITVSNNPDVQYSGRNETKLKRNTGCMGSRDSLSSYYSNAGEVNYGSINVTGDIQFGLDYDYKTVCLEIRIKKCRDLAPADMKKNRSDPYVKSYLLPDKSKTGKRKTKVKKNTLNPVFDEILRYSIAKSELENRTLWLTVWHNDRFGRNDFLGEVTIPFDYYRFEGPTLKWCTLQQRQEFTPSSLAYKGELSISLKYVTVDAVLTGSTTSLRNSRGGSRTPESMSSGQLHVFIKDARNLTAVRSGGYSDPFCKGYLLPEKNRTSKQKTPVVKKNCNPVWNHLFIFEDVSANELSDRCLELTLWDYDRIASNDFLGGIRLNLGSGIFGRKYVDWMDASGAEVSLWQSMMSSHNTWVDGTLILRANMNNRK